MLRHLARSGCLPIVACKLPDVDTCVQLPSGFSNQFFDFFLFFFSFFCLDHNCSQVLEKTSPKSSIIGCQMYDLSGCTAMLPGQFCFVGCLAPYATGSSETTANHRIVSDTKKTGQKNMQKETDTPSLIHIDTITLRQCRMGILAENPFR